MPLTCPDLPHSVVEEGIIHSFFSPPLSLFGFKGVFRWLCHKEKQSVTNALSANSLRFAQIYFFAKCLLYELLFQTFDLGVCVIAFGTEVEFDFRLCAGRAYGNHVAGLVKELEHIG